MTLAEIQAEIILRTKQLEICDSLHDAQIATTEDDLVKAGLPLVDYTYQSGIVDDTLLVEFNESILNANGIYTTGSFTITNPVDEVYIMKEAVVTIDIDGDTNCKINVMGGGSLTLNASGKSYATVKAYDNSLLNITITEDAMVNLETRDQSETTVTQNNNSVFHLSSHGNSVVTHYGNDTSFALATLFHHSSLTYTLSGTAAMTPTSFNSATAINASS